MLRPLCVLTAALVVATSPPTLASRTACRLLTDATHDDQLTPATGRSPSSAPSMDIVSADIASDDRRVTAVIRLRDLSLTDPHGTPGSGYWLELTTARATFLLHAERSVESTRYLLVHRTSANVGEVLAHVTGVFDEDRDEVRITATRAAFQGRAPLRRGDVVTGLTAVSLREQGVAALPVQPLGRPMGFMNGIAADDATGSATYRLGAPSCVVPGA
jgi:hypothetical protein